MESKWEFSTTEDQGFLIERKYLGKGMERLREEVSYE
jgi:hypothetical protein